MTEMKRALGVVESGCLRAAVIGAGNMGAGIAAQFANAGVMVDLLDIPSDAGRNARAEAGIAAQIKAGGFMGPAPVALVRPGNVEDDLGRLADADWIVEAVIENLAVKRDLYAKIEPLLKPGAVISSNTSTIPRAELIEGRSPAFAEQFVISHFFNPPRHMALLELVAPPGSAAYARAALAGRKALGKTVIECRDTPGFIANRIGCTWMAVAIVEALRLGLTPEQADAVHTAFGVPRTGVFGLMDLVGVDMIPSIWGSLMRELPAEDTINRFDLPAQKLVQEMIAAGRFGRKAGGGFYRKTPGGIEVIDPATGAYVAESGFVAANLPGGGRDLEALLADEGPLGSYARAVLGTVLHYAQDHAAEIASAPADVDTAMELGYAWRRGPFRILDGLSETARASMGLSAKGVEAAKGKASGPKDRLARAKAGSALAGNEAASLWDIGAGVACLELHTKMNAIDSGVHAMIETTLAQLGGKITALVIGNHDPRAFSAGANLGEMAARIEAGEFDALEAFIARGQTLFAQLRGAPVPVVSALRGLALGGGCEVTLHSTAVVAHAEAKIALPEHTLGLLPGWGGTTTLLMRGQAAKGVEAGTVAAFGALLLPRPAGSAREAQAAALLDPAAEIVMHPDDVLDAAAAQAEAMAPGYGAAKPGSVVLGGAAMAETLLEPLRARVAAGTLSAADLEVDTVIAEALTGGAAAPGTVIGEEEMRALERAAFVRLTQIPLTLERIRHMLRTGKALKT
ncbi:MAG: 3-hydroxyacyl-CoA dehydrogenase NAD-binding domain-containing protein [Paenirhodobacter sp.]|uniref:3-hydroxyacyl-CoA dehydrogenase/enoyl-CoA hydratase family protein n=1 Tax=Paenirhodobacter sp. TaxID=1965326 RepID=UPI003D0F747B